MRALAIRHRAAASVDLANFSTPVAAELARGSADPAFRSCIRL